MKITPFQPAYLEQAARLFSHNFAALRLSLPILPDTLQQPAQVAARLEELMTTSPGLNALRDEQVVGYLGWYLIDNFRSAPRKAAYCPEWAHAAVEEGKPAIYRALYRAASTIWSEAGCQVHAISLLAHDRAAQETWFWNGFGLAVIDAVRSIQPLAPPLPPGLPTRQATPADLDTLVALDAEHWAHYSAPPTLMSLQDARSAAEFSRLFDDPRNSVWLALDGGEPAGLMTFEGSSFGAADIVAASDSVAITGAYIRPALRGRGFARALLDAALRHYAARGFTRCAVDFESFNPEAAAFWPKYFDMACLSLMRVPERSIL